MPDERYCNTENNSRDKYRFTASVDEDTYENVKYWAKKKKMSVNDVLREALALYVQHQNKDYDLPTLEAMRLNQMLDAISVLSSNINSLEKITTSGFNSLISLTRGDNYLLDDDDGDFGS